MPDIDMTDEELVRGLRELAQKLKTYVETGPKDQAILRRVPYLTQAADRLEGYAREARRGA